jgi:hypothetical protein
MNPVGYHVYGYVRGNPVRFVDPYGYALLKPSPKPTTPASVLTDVITYQFVFDQLLWHSLKMAALNVYNSISNQNCDKQGNSSSKSVSSGAGAAAAGGGRKGGGKNGGGGDGPWDPHWDAKDLSDPDFSFGCEKVAIKIQQQIGGTIHTLRPPVGASNLGLFQNYPTGWASHAVVVKAGRVYDAFTGYKGMTIGGYKLLWEAFDVIKFGF